MADELSPLRQERERRGLSRKAVADAIGTTVHHYWCCEMPPFNGPPDVFQRACTYLGVGMDQEQATPAQRAETRGESVWRCPRCGTTTKQPGSATEVGHSCRKKNNTYQKFELQPPETETIT